MGLSPQCQDLDGLCPCIRQRYPELLARCRASGFDLTLIETLRQPDRQKHYIELGVSWTMLSKHLPQPPKGLALAFDCAPTPVIHEPLWNPKSELWIVMGQHVEGLGLLWGGRWRRRMKDGKLKARPDRPHCYLRFCECRD